MNLRHPNHPRNIAQRRRDRIAVTIMGAIAAAAVLVAWAHAFKPM